MAAGLASTGAATVTSVFNVAGTLIGAALTAMIITGGSAILRAYLENASSRVRSAPKKVRERVTQNGRRDTPPEDSSKTRQGFGERLRSAFRWFFHLSSFRQSAILRRALVGGAVAVVLGIGLVTAIEYGIGNSLSCSIWNQCGTGATAAGTTDEGPVNTRPALFGGGRQTATSPSDTDQQQVTPGGEAPSGVDGGGSPLPGSGEQQPGGQQSPGNSGTPTPGPGEQSPGSGTPSEPAAPDQQPADGSGGSGTPGSGTPDSGAPDGSGGAGGAEGGSQ